MPDADPLYYHSIELPDGFHEGSWDCRKVVDSYLGHVDFAGKTVLEIGPANGFFTFEMERRGAAVTCLDLGAEGQWDLVPGKHASLQRDVRRTLARIEAAFWKAHEAVGSKSRMVYGRVYDAPALTGKHQIGTMGNVLQHLRDPIGALMALAECVSETIVITETLWTNKTILEREPVMLLVPRADLPETGQTWWQVSVPLVRETLRMLGFPYLRVEYHEPVYFQLGRWKPVRHMTWVGQRRPGAAEVAGFLRGFFPVEHEANMSWVWAAGPSSGMEVSIPQGVRGSLRMRIFHAAPRVMMKVLRNGVTIFQYENPATGQSFAVPLKGEAEPISLTLMFDQWNGQPQRFAEGDPRPLSVAFSSIRIVTDTQEFELVI